MCGDVWVWDECGGDGRHCDEEVGPKVCAEAGDEAGCGVQGGFFFDVEVEAVEVVF